MFYIVLGMATDWFLHCCCCITRDKRNYYYKPTFNAFLFDILTTPFLFDSVLIVNTINLYKVS